MPTPEGILGMFHFIKRGNKKIIYLAKALSSQRKKYELYEFKIYGIIVFYFYSLLNCFVNNRFVIIIPPFLKVSKPAYAGG